MNEEEKRKRCTIAQNAVGELTSRGKPLTMRQKKLVQQSISERGGRRELENMLKAKPTFQKKIDDLLIEADIDILEVVEELGRIVFSKEGNDRDKLNGIEKVFRLRNMYPAVTHKIEPVHTNPEFINEDGSAMNEDEIKAYMLAELSQDMSEYALGPHIEKNSMDDDLPDLDD